MQPVKPSNMQEKQKQQQVYFRKMKNDYEKVFSTGEGKRVLEDLAKSCSANKSTFDADALVMAYNEGLRSAFLHIRDMATPVPEDEKKDKPKEAIT